MGRVFGFLGVVITMAIGMYIYSLQVKAIEPGPGAVGDGTEAPLIAGVKSDLLGIANAERGYQASEGKYASMEELVAGKYLSVRGDRPPYVYDVETTSGGFKVSATRTVKGAPAQLWVTETMQVQASD